MVRCAIYLVSLMCLLTAHNSSAHQLSTAYLNIEQNNSATLSGQWQIRWFDLELALGLDSDSNGALEWGEVLMHKPLIISYLNTHLNLSNAEGSCVLEYSPALKQDTHFNEGYLSADFVSDCALTGPFSIAYSAVFSQDEDHKVIVNMLNADGLSSQVISTDSKVIFIHPDTTTGLNTFATYLEQGVIHIWLGYDHILFLCVLLLSSVLVRKQGKWSADISASQVVKNTLWIVTAFTLAHSLTLTATAMHWISFSSRWVELGIALSVFLTAVNNIWPVIVRLGWLTFGFGLLHGMGFASVLIEIGLPPQQTLLSVLAFNLGVELGQLAILLVIIPLLLFARCQRWYRKYGMNMMSAMIAAVALIWSIQRV